MSSRSTANNVTENIPLVNFEAITVCVPEKVFAIKWFNETGAMQPRELVVDLMSYPNAIASTFQKS